MLTTAGNHNLKLLQVAAGQAHTLALLSDGSVWGFGWNMRGQLGNGTSHDFDDPVQAIGLSDVQAISACAYYSTALRKDGTVWMWGLMNHVIHPQNILNIRTEQDKKNYYFNSQEIPTQVAGIEDATAIACGRHYTLILNKDGTVLSLIASKPFEASTFNPHQQGTLLPVPNLPSAKAICAGEGYPLVLDFDGNVWAVTWDYSHSSGDNVNVITMNVEKVAGLSSITAIAAGGIHFMALRSDGVVHTWGGNWNGQLGTGTHTNYREKQDETSIRTVELGNATAIAAGERYSLALLSDGTVWAWGNNIEGQLGNGSNAKDEATPQRVIGLTDIAHIETGLNNSFAIQADGTLWGWGWNKYQQLGPRTSLVVNSPTQMPKIPPI